MKKEITLHTRREFLRTSLLGAAVSATLPSFLAQTFTALNATAADSPSKLVTGKDGTILVVLQLAGGNDGINTVVPYGNDFYHRARPRLGVQPKNVLKLTDQIGLHPNLSGFKELYEGGHLGIIQGVGYPNPNRSHFRSTEIWQTASDADRNEKYGWIGRYFDHACAGADPTVGVSIGKQTPQAFSASHPLGVSFDNPASYRFAGERPGASDDESSMSASGDAVSGDTIGSIAGKSVPHGMSTMDFLERAELDAQVSSDKIRAILGKTENRGAYPQSQLANSLRMVSQLIAGKLPTRVFYVSQGGYDTHSNQIGTHDRLMRELGDAVNAFVKDLKAQGNLDRVVLFTFSEFGRRVSENANGGTDHGAAAPMFLVGGKSKSGLLGQYPSLAPADLYNGDVKYTTDFRSVYAGLLEHWLQTPSAPILGRNFPPFQVV